MVFRPRVKSYNPINDIFAITNLFRNQFYANKENDLRSKTLHKLFVRSTLVVVIYEKGLKHAVPRWQKMDIYIQHNSSPDGYHPQ